MVSYEVMGGPLADASVWRGALLWAIALYVPLSARSARWNQAQGERATRIGASTGAGDQQLLLALVTALSPSSDRWIWVPSWASSLGVVAVGWSVLLILANAGKDD